MGITTSLGGAELMLEILIFLLFQLNYMNIHAYVYVQPTHTRIFTIPHLTTQTEKLRQTNTNNVSQNIHFF